MVFITIINTVHHRSTGVNLKSLSEFKGVLSHINFEYFTNRLLLSTIQACIFDDMGLGKLLGVVFSPEHEVSLGDATGTNFPES